jgi:hypothetical protein
LLNKKVDKFQLVIITAACLIYFSCVTFLIFRHGTTTLNIMTFFIMTLRITEYFVKVSLTTLSITTLCCYAESRNAEYRFLFIVMLNVVMLSVLAPTSLHLGGGGAPEEKLLSFPQTID